MSGDSQTEAGGLGLAWMNEQAMRIRKVGKSVQEVGGVR
jgi:hypothetical protein